MADRNMNSAQQGTRITFERVVKAYGANTVLHGIDLDIAPGEFVALLGPSGCGKTTMLRCLAGLEQVTDGRIVVNGTDVATTPANKRDMGVVFQQYSLFPHMTVGQNIEFGLRMRRVSGAERTTRVRDSLELVGLGHLEHRYAHTLSGGQQQRVALARALVTRPRALLLDEPLSALDAKVRVRLRDEIKAIQSELGITTIFVTHDQEEALAIADRVAVMQGGFIEQLGSPEELYQAPSSPFVAAFIGESNELVGTLRDGRVEVYGAALPVIDAAGLPERTTVRAFVRPEHVTLARSSEVDTAAPAGGTDTTGAAGQAATVVSTGFLGSQRRTVVRVPDGTLLTVQHATNAQFTPDDAVHLHFSGEPVAVQAAE